MRKAKYLFFLSLLLFSRQLLSQDTGNFTQFFFNPYTLNPSFAGIDGRPAFFAAYRKQWAGITGGPTISNISFHTPFKSGLNFGLNAANDQRGILSNSGLLLSLAYKVPLGTDSYLRFGLSAGGSWNTIDLEKLQASDPNFSNDLAYLNLLNQNASIIGNAGISLHLKSFHIGAAIPNLFAPSYVSVDAFTISEVKPFEAMVVHASNRFYFGNDKHIFEPYVVYRINNGLRTQYEAAGVIHLNHAIWIGGSYKQDYGISAFGGIKLNKSFAIGGSYSLKNTGINELNFPSYEIQLSYLGGASNAKSKTKSKSKTNTHPVFYSFVDTEKHKLTAKEKLAEQKRKEELEKQKQQAELAKKEAEAKKLQEAEAKRQQEEEAKRTHEAEVKKQQEEEAKKIHDAELKQQQAADAARKAEEEKLRKEQEEKEKALYDELAQKVNKNTLNQVERHETVTKGKHPQELEKGNYVIVGVFGQVENAKKLAKRLVDTGFNANYGFLSEKGLWYVHVFVGDDINDTRTERDKYRKQPMFSNAWLLTVQ